jgi:DhnA family fructose-bisphosphate aldolase class Ia
VPYPHGNRQGNEGRETEIFGDSQEGGGGVCWGVSSGSNVFQQEGPTKILEAICFLVHQGARTQEAWGSYKQVKNSQ